MFKKEITLFGSTYLEAATSEIINLSNTQDYSVHMVYDDTTPAAGAFTANVTDICTKNAHGFKTGLKVQVSSSDTLPGGLSASTDYFVIVGTANTFSLSDTYAHAIAGTNIINITDAGTGTHTITPTALSGCSAKIQYSNDGTNWDDIASASVNITADGNKMFNYTGVNYKYAKVVFAISSGQVAFTSYVMIKGD